MRHHVQYAEQWDHTATSDCRFEDAAPAPNIDGTVASAKGDAGVHHHSQFETVLSIGPFMRFRLGWGGSRLEYRTSALGHS
jgi:hypothetical protein